MTDWLEGAPCLSVDGDLWFSIHPGEIAEARRLCGGCPARLRCLNIALEAEAGLAESSRFGIYGGTTPADRARLDGAA